MKHYTLVTIIRLDTGASGMYQIPASGGEHLGNMVLPPPAASLTGYPLSLALLFHLSIRQNSTRGLLDLHRFIAHLTCAHIFVVHLTIAGHVRDVLELSDRFAAACWSQLKCKDHIKRYPLPPTTVEARSYHYPYLRVSTRAQPEIQIENYFVQSPLAREQQLRGTVLRAVVLSICESLACVIQSWELWQWKIISLGWG